MKAIILEDEQIAANRLKRMLGEVDADIEVTQIFETIEETVSYFLHHGQPELLFLDIHVADGNSFEIFKAIDITSKVIFVTAYDEYAVDAFRRNAIDYLLKPIKIEELEEAIVRAKKSKIDINETIGSMQPESSRQRFLIRFGSKLYVVMADDIAYVYSENKISYFIQHDGKKIPSDIKMQDIIDMLETSKFFRINRQCIVNLNAISEIVAYSKARLKIKVSPTLNADLVISTETTPQFKKWLGGKN